MLACSSLTGNCGIPDQATHVAAARQAAKKIAAILDEAHAATATALNVSRSGCSGQGQFQLGTEAALQPHLRTILLIKDGQVWCSSLPRQPSPDAPSGILA
ncbi:CSS-motif domain-containing protein [Klebsiella variicola subsp. variicola]|nr:CSS-motif domain-containing protein [Klebsiella variicola subsp. variicola]